MSTIDMMTVAVEALFPPSTALTSNVISLVAASWSKDCVRIILPVLDSILNLLSSSSPGTNS